LTKLDAEALGRVPASEDVPIILSELERGSLAKERHLMIEKRRRGREVT